MPRSTVPHPNPLSSARILVIGGTSGIGYAIASAALSHASSVHISSSNPSKVSSTIAHLHSLYPSATISGSVADLSDPNTIEANLQSTLNSATSSLGGPLDHIAYTAGELFTPTPLAAITAANAFSSWTVRYLGPLLLSKLIAANPGRYLANGVKSSLTFTSGTPTRKPRPGISSIVGAVGALETVGRALALDLAPVRVNVVLLGSVRTELTERFGEEVMGSWAEKTLGGEVGSAEDAAEAYLFCMRSAFVTGQEVVVDGGALYR